MTTQDNGSLVERTALEKLRDQILKERDAGRIVFWGLPDELMAASLDDFLKQPADGILYDLNRLEEVVMTFLPDPKWVNDFAVATVIRRLMAEKDKAQSRERDLVEALKAINDHWTAGNFSRTPELWDQMRAALAGGDKG